MRICLVNTNRIKPPISPIGLEYVAEALNNAGHHVEILDLCWADDCDSAIAGFFEGSTFDIVGISLRNTDDCAFTSRRSFLGEFAGIVSSIRRRTNALIVLGGVGFSAMPEHVMELCEADAGIWGEGEFTFVKLAYRMEEKKGWLDLPSLILRRNGMILRNPPATGALTDLPPMNRRWVDNLRYFREGGQIGIETKRGCSGRCVYCADPVSKGKDVRVRPPEEVVDELERLIEQKIDCFHTCDSEFNLPQWHAIEICREIIQRDLRLRWYAYCSPAPFTQELAHLMRQAGCAGINFGVDSGDEEMLRRLKRDFTPDDIRNAALACRKADIAVMFDLLLGSPGETRDSIIRTIELIRQAGPDRTGVSVGLRVYPGTELAEIVPKEKNCLTGKEPVFFIDPEIAPIIFELLEELVGDDRRFFFFDPSRPDRNYNYNSNQVLVDSIKRGFQGAYWDILRRIG